ncbi:Endo-1,4-beta-xylanase 5, partial [Linum perenne]
VAGSVVEGLAYDYTASIECLEIPHRPQYNGGIIRNPDLNHGLVGWSKFGSPQLQTRVSSNNNTFIVAHSRSHPTDSVSQMVYLQNDLLYTFSAWIQVTGQDNVAVTASFMDSRAVVAEPGCWSMLKGGLTVNTSGMVQLYFQSSNSTVDVWIDSVSLQPFTHQEWSSHQHQTIEQTRKGKVRIKVVDKQGNPLPNATVSIQQNSRSFPFGCAINKNILSNAAYQNWFTSRRFSVTTFENEMKWYSIEPSRGHLDYSVADSLMQFAKQHKVAVRGHNVLWDDPIMQPYWLNSLPPRQFGSAVRSRINSVMSRYKGQVIAWDVLNENLHFSLIENKLGKYASALVYNLAYKVDGGLTPLFLNEYSTIEEKRDKVATPARYLQKLREIRKFSNNYKINFGIGLEGHFNANPNIPYMRSSLDILATANLPIWLTEVDVEASPHQASSLEQVLREGHAHPMVQGIVVWGAWSPKGCYKMCLTDNNFKNLPTGYVVDKLLREWGGRGASSSSSYVDGKTDENGYLETSLYHGDYNVLVTVGNSSVANKRLLVAPSASTRKQPLLLQPTT